MYSLFVTLVVFRSLKLRQLPALRRDDDPVLAGALLPGRRLDLRLAPGLPVPQIVTDFIVSFTRDPIMIMIIIVVINVLLGTFMDACPPS